MNYLAIGLVVILLIVLYYVYYYFTNNTLTSGLQPLNSQLTVTYDKLINPNSRSYSYQVWIYISTPTNNSTQIFFRGDTSIGSSYSEFEVDLNGQTLTLNADAGTAHPTQIMTITNNFPVQKWVYLVINVYNLKTFEAYINGKLAKTVNVSTQPVPDSQTSNLYIGNKNISGYTTKFTRLPSTLDAETIWKNYLSGNGIGGLSGLLPYGLNMSISNGEDVVRVVNVF